MQDEALLTSLKKDHCATADTEAATQQKAARCTSHTAAAMPRILLVVAAASALQPRLHAKAPRRVTTAAELISETDAAALADVVAAALETDAVIDLRVNRGENDTRFKRVSGRVVELKNKRLLQLTYKRRGRRPVQARERPRGRAQEQAAAPAHL